MQRLIPTVGERGELLPFERANNGYTSLKLPIFFASADRPDIHTLVHRVNLDSINLDNTDRPILPEIEIAPFPHELRFPSQEDIVSFIANSAVKHSVLPGLVSGNVIDIRHTNKFTRQSSGRLTTGVVAPLKSKSKQMKPLINSGFEWMSMDDLATSIAETLAPPDTEQYQRQVNRIDPHTWNLIETVFRKPEELRPWNELTG